MTNDTEKTVEPVPTPPAKPGVQDKVHKADTADTDTDKPEELSEEELRLMADTMPGECPGDD